MPRKPPASAPLAGTPAQAISPGGLLADAFPGPTWDRWRAILKAAWGERLTAAELALFREVAGDRNPPSRQVRELWCVAGRWSGKDSIASGIACVAALIDYRPYLRPGETPVILCLASDRDQAKIVHGYIAGYFQENPLLRALVARETADGLELTTGVSIVIGTANYRAVRGRTVVCAILDEVGVWRSDSETAPDIETYTALTPALARVPGSILIGISTPYRRQGLLYERCQAFFGKNDDAVLVVRGASPLFNPKVPQTLIDADLARDPERAGAEWLAEWRSDLSDFIGRDLLEAATDHGVIVRPPLPAVSYVAWVDASGGRGDAFTAAIAHGEGDAVVLDAVYERRAPFSPTEVVPEVAELLRRYRIAVVTGDKYAADFCTGAFAAVGIRYQDATQDRSAVYLSALPLFTSGRVRLIDNARLAYQFAALERRVTKFGRDRVDHPRATGDDLANAAAGALTLAAAEARPALIRAAMLLADGAGVPQPTICDSIHVVVWPDADGLAAVTWWSFYGQGNPPCVMLDFDVAPIASNTVETALRRAQDYVTATRMLYSGRLYLPRVLAQQYLHIGATAVPPGWLQDITALRLAVGTQAAAGAVKLSAAAAEHARGTVFAGSLESWMKQPDALAMSFMLGTVLSLNLPAPG